MNFQLWFLVFLIVLAVAGLIGYLANFSRQAYVGWRFEQAVGGKVAAARLLRKIEEDNEALLAGALSAKAFGVARRS